MFDTDLRDCELDLIKSCVDSFEEPTYLEIGVWFGGTFSRILKHMETKSKCHAIGVDLFEDLILEAPKFNVPIDSRTQTHQIFDNPAGCAVVEGVPLNVSSKKGLEEALLAHGLNNFTLLKGDSSVVIPQLTKSIDVFFIDGNHTHVQSMLDFNLCFEKSHVGSYFVFHNTTFEEVELHYRDGGPYKTCEILKEDTRLELQGSSHRTTYFKRIN